MFAYCNNNPVCNADLSGEAPSNVIFPVCLGGNGLRKKQPLLQVEEYMIEAGEEFGVDPAMIATVIAVERAYNVNILDLGDVPVGLLGGDTSVGFGQVLISTAQLVEDANYIEKSRSRWDRIWRLVDKKTNIRYVAAYLAYVRDIWVLQDPDFEKHPDIWWTIYNTGKIAAHPNPEPGILGAEANAYYSYYEWLFRQ